MNQHTGIRLPDGTWRCSCGSTFKTEDDHLEHRLGAVDHRGREMPLDNGPESLKRLLRW